MKVTEFSVRNPLVVAAITVAVGIFGVFAYWGMGVAITPNVNFPAVVVTTVYPGADPETVESNVTKPIEDAIAGLQNIDANGLTSVSSSGVSTVSVQFNTAANPDLISVDVERVVNSVRNRLPPEVEAPAISKFDINARGVATVVLSGQQPLATLQDFAENVLQKQFNAIPGVGSTNIRSGITREVHVLVDEASLKSRGLSINQVIGALQAQQLEVPAGSITVGGSDLSVYFDALATSTQQLGNVAVLQTPNGAVYLRDVAEVQDTVKKRSAIVRVDGQEGLALVVVKLPDANTISVVDGVKQTIERLQPQLPPGSRLDVVVDGSTYTSRSFNTVQRALIEAVLATGLILFLFLHTWRSTLIVLVSIPTSLLTAFVMMSALGYTLNLMTMLALTLSVGILVDDSIVVLENIYRHLDMGKPPFAAAVEGRGEIGLAAITITFVDVVVYVPIAVMVSGVPAQFLRPFALVIATATLVSLAVSFTLTPLLASRFLRHDAGQGKSLLARFGQAWDRGFIFLERKYESLLRHALPHRWLVIGVGLASFGFGIGLWVLGLIGSDIFPSGDQSEIDISLSMPSATSLETTNAVALQMERVLRGYQEVRGIYSVVGQTGGGLPGADGGGGNSQAQITALLVPPSERTRSSAEIGSELRQIFVSNMPAAKIQIGLPNPFGFGGFGGQPIQVQVQGTDPGTLNTLAAQVEEAVRAVPGAAAVRRSNDNLQAQLRATIDWPRAADLGVTAQNAGAALRAAIDGFRSNGLQFRQPGRTAIDIRVLNASANANAASIQDIATLPVSTANGGIVQLGQFTTIRQVQIPTSIRHVNRLRGVTIGAEPGEGKLVGDVQAAVQRAVSQIPLPAGYAVTYAGQGQQGSTAFGDIFRALEVAVLLMYMLMLMLFGSLVLPLAVLMSLPLAVVGSFGAMALSHAPFTLFSLLGFAVLVGLVGKNAILLVDYTEILQSRGYDRTTALLEAGPTRLRPIVMTTLSVMAALLPIASGLEEGSELLKSAAVVLIGGLLTSTLLTLVFVPAMFTIFDDLQQAVLRRFGPGRASAPLARPSQTRELEADLVPRPHGRNGWERPATAAGAPVRPTAWWSWLPHPLARLANAGRDGRAKTGTPAGRR
ncbi:MAG TPA: efflux RND transporter permease subunit [Chloroflexota bacterium]|nr:efflux RND transporter permease subunit [Chloroflexota bacterium]